MPPTQATRPRLGITFLTDDWTALSPARRRQHAMSIWCGFASASAAEAHVGPAITALYGMPYDAFRKWAPAGTPEQVAEFLVPYWEAGCSVLNLVPQAGGVEAGLEAVIATWQHFRKETA